MPEGFPSKEVINAYNNPQVMLRDTMCTMIGWSVRSNLATLEHRMQRDAKHVRKSRHRASPRQ